MLTWIQMMRVMMTSGIKIQCITAWGRGYDIHIHLSNTLRYLGLIWRLVLS